MTLRLLGDLDDLEDRGRAVAWEEVVDIESS